MTAQNYMAPESAGRLSQGGLIVGGAALLVCAIGYFRNPEQFLRSYLIGYLLTLGVALGCLGLLMLQHMTGGDWGIVIRRPLESATRTLPLLAVLFLPIAFGARKIYLVWTSPGWVAPSALQKAYLTLPGFYLRAAVYFAIWLTLALLLNAWSKRQDADPEDRGLRRKMQLLSGPGIVLYVFTVTFAAVDWVMSLSPQWNSTIFGFLFVAGQAISAMCLTIMVIVTLARTEPMSRVLQPRHLHDLGKLLFTFVMLWAYFSFSQLLIIWSGNLPEEISFYRPRLSGSWGYVAVALLLFHFALPFFLLLSRDVKRSARFLPKLAAFVILMRYVDLYWISGAQFSPGGLHVHFLDFAAPLAVGGIWLAWYARQLKERPLLPLGDPRLAEALEHHEH
ncbi:MAG TPA: hypothetical protein VEH49_01140 [Methylomirabilota bacterium]|nr:hypothetical protein [Methylomirabilota bacterium]